MAGLLVQHLLLASTPGRDDGHRHPPPPEGGTRSAGGAGIPINFRSQTRYDAQGSEHELCWVYAGRSAERPLSNVNEVAAWRYITPQALQAEIARAPESFTPWFKLEWANIVHAYPRVLGTTASIANGP